MVISSDFKHACNSSLSPPPLSVSLLKPNSFNLECLPGYFWVNCSKECVFPFYGIRCKQTCLCQKDDCNFENGCREGKFFYGFVKKVPIDLTPNSNIKVHDLIK